MKSKMLLTCRTNKNSKIKISSEDKKCADVFIYSGTFFFYLVDGRAQPNIVEIVLNACE